MYTISAVRLQKILGKFLKKNKKLEPTETEVYQKIKGSIVRLLEYHKHVTAEIAHTDAYTRRELPKKDGVSIIGLLYDDLANTYIISEIDKPLFVKNIFHMVIRLKANRCTSPQLSLL